MKTIIPILLLLTVFACQKKKEEKKETEATKVEQSTTPDTSYVYFKYPQNNSVVSSPVFIEMGVVGMEVEPAGESKTGYGHHHILINQTHWTGGQIIPMSDTTLHFGKGQKDTSLELDPGKYTITLQFADGIHKSYGKEMATSINITVE